MKFVTGLLFVPTVIAAFHPFNRSWVSCLSHDTLDLAGDII